MPLGIIIALVIALGGGLSLAAQSSLPGDALFPLKVNVNEEVRAGFALSAEAKADFEAKRAQERLKEAEELSVREDVNAATRTNIEANFKAFADRAQARINELSTVDAQAAADLASNFQTALAAHEKVLARLGSMDLQSNNEVKGLQAEVDRELKDTIKERVHAETKIKTEDHGPEVKSAAEGKIMAATNVIAEVTSFINSNKDQMSADAVAKANARLAVAQNLLVQAKAKLAAGSNGDAFILGNEAIRTAHGAKLLIEAQEDLDVDLHLDGVVHRSPAPSFSPHVSPMVEGLMESETHVGGRVDVHSGF